MRIIIGQNGKLNPNATLGRIVNYNGEDYLVTPDDWEDVGTRTGKRQEYNVSVSAANDKSNFYASIGYLDNEGITNGSDYERITGRLRADYQAKKWLKVGANLSFTHHESNLLDNNGSSTSTANVWALVNQLAPIYPAYIRNADGSIKVDDNGIKMMDYGSGLNAGLNRPYIQDANPIQDNLLNTYNNEGNAASANGFADIEFFPGLKLTLNGTYNLDEYRYTMVYNPYYGQFDTTGGTVYKEHDRAYDYNLQQLLNYTTTIGEKHNLNIMLGHEYYNTYDYYLYASKSNMFSQSNKELNGAVIDGQGAGSYKERYNNEGYFGRAQYDYDNKIFLSASLRRDASSRFAKDHRWGTFWSFGAAWIISKEKWFNASWVDDLKVKASIGSQGNDNISNYLYTDTYSISNSSGDIGVSFNSKGTEDITWETNRNINVGAEFSLFKRLSGSIEYYHRKTSDMLFAFSVAPSLGYSSYYDNVGDLYNAGVELTLNYNAVRTKNINWDVNFNIGSLRNRITMLHEDQKNAITYDSDGKAYHGYTSGNFFIAEGVSMYTWRLKEYAGVSEDGESMWYKNVYETDEEGNEVWVGRETTTTYSDADYYVTNKSTVPDFYGGFGTSFAAYGFDFSINFSFQLGGYGYDSTYALFMSSPYASYTGYNYHKDLYNSWSVDNTDSNIPRFQFGDQYSSSMSTRFLTSASYLNIENINVGYTFPSAWTRKLSIEAFRLYCSCENVAYISKRKGFDPRQAYDDTSTAANYSPMRTISIGLSLTF
ncbi:MAG: SusC/RagA family TonB-linked outer membrane protein [Prevotellaceae bacterium]|nr:SusC/RagA family TonB-linked outer membrane protein [Prevotellaceae bacterium]